MRQAALVEFLSRLLEPDEREAVLGDLTESGGGFGALRDVVGLVARRQAALLKSWQPWVIFAGTGIPFAFWLSLTARFAADRSAITLWLYLNNWDWSLFAAESFRHDLGFLRVIPFTYLHLACWSWGLGFLFGMVSRRRIVITAALFCLALVAGEVVGTPLLAFGSLAHRARDYHPNAVVFEVEFYRVVYPLLVQFALVLIPSLAGMLEGSQIGKRRLLWVVALTPILMVLGQSLILWWVGPTLRPRIWSATWFHLFEFLPYWPVLYWLTDTVQRQRRLRLA